MENDGKCRRMNYPLFMVSDISASFAEYLLLTINRKKVTVSRSRYLSALCGKVAQWKFSKISARKNMSMSISLTFI